MNALKADPRTVDLRALAPHFYNLSERILELFEEEEMVDVLSNVCFNNYLLSRFFFFFHLSDMTMLTENRHSESGLQRSLIMHIILEGPWETASNSYVVLMKQNVNVCQYVKMHPRCTM